MYKLGLRISEVADYNRLYSHAIKFKNCKINHNLSTFDVTLESGKHLNKPVTYAIKCNPTLFRHLSAYIRFRGNRKGPLFLHPDGTPFSGNILQKR